MRVQRAVLCGLAGEFDDNLIGIVINQALEYLRHGFRHRDGRGKDVEIEHVAAGVAETLLWFTAGPRNLSSRGWGCGHA